MAINQFIPELWSAAVTTSFQANQLVLPTLNTQFTGEVRRGNTLHIIGATTPTIVDYAAAGRTITAEALGDTEVLLNIDQEKAFSINIDDVDMVQAAGAFDAWTATAGRALAEDAESFAIATIKGGATNANTGAVVVDTPAEAKAAVRAIRKKMVDAKVPSAGRYIVANPDFVDLLLQDLSDVAAAGSNTELRDGVVLRLYGLDIIESPLVGEAVPAAIGYQADQVAFVSQIQAMESLRSQTSFSDIVRGLNVYGAKVLKGEAVYKFISA